MTEAFEDLEIRGARIADLDVVLSILEQAARWLVCRGIEGWTPGSFSRQRIAERIDRGEMYLAELAGQSVGTLALQRSDEETWGTVADDTGYVHGLAISRGFAGTGLGRELLRWAENMVAASGKSTSGSTAWRRILR